MSKVVDEARKWLSSEDKVQKSFHVGYKDKEGFLVLSNRKLLFLEVKGFLRPRSNLILEIPYEKIRNAAVAASHRLEITEAENIKRVFVTYDAQASEVEAEIKKLVEPPTPRVVA